MGHNQEVRQEIGHKCNLEGREECNKIQEDHLQVQWKDIHCKDQQKGSCKDNH